MNLYWNNFIYYGTIISSEQYEFLMSVIDMKDANTLEDIFDILVYSSICVRKCVNTYFLFILTTYYNFRNHDPIFTSRHIKQGFISLNEVRELLQTRNLSRINSILIPDKDEKERLDAIIALLEIGSIDHSLKLTPRLEIIETLNDKLDMGSGILTHQLPVKDN